jgi:hypothetical protein
MITVESLPAAIRLGEVYLRHQEHELRCGEVRWIDTDAHACTRAPHQDGPHVEHSSNTWCSQVVRLWSAHVEPADYYIAPGYCPYIFDLPTDLAPCRLPWGHPGEPITITR